MKFKFVFVGLVVFIVVGLSIFLVNKKSTDKNDFLLEKKTISVLDQQIQDFLNKEGEYTKEKMSEMAIWGSRFSYEDGNGTDLGILRISEKKIEKI